MTTNSKIRSDFEAWWSEFQETHEEWPFADKEALLFAAWENALSQQLAQESQPENEFSTELWAELFTLRAEVSPPNGEVSWKEAAIRERHKRSELYRENEALKLKLAAMEPKL